MDAHTPAKWGLLEGAESEGKKLKEKEGGAEGVNMGGEEEAGEEQPKWKPRPVADPMGYLCDKFSLSTKRIYPAHFYTK